MAQKILIVDDERDLVSIWGTLLKAQGFDVITAFSGTEALTKTFQEKPDLLLLDVILPGPLTGYQVFEQLQKDPHAKNIPVIVISARKNMGDLFPRSGLITFVSKPIDANVLVGKIAQILTLQKLGESKNVLIFGIQEFTINRIKEWFEKKGYKVATAFNEYDAIQKCEKLTPKFFFCQFCADPAVLDSTTVYKKAIYLSGADKVGFYLYCPQQNLAEAKNAFPPDVIVAYTDSKDLLEKIEKDVVR